MRSPVDNGHRLASYDTLLVVSGGVDCSRRRQNVYDKKPRRYAKGNRTAHLTACSDKPVAYVTNNKRLYSTFCTVEANYWQTRSIARPLCDSRVTCFHIHFYSLLVKNDCEYFCAVFLFTTMPHPWASTSTWFLNRFYKKSCICWQLMLVTDKNRQAHVHALFTVSQQSVFTNCCKSFSDIWVVLYISIISVTVCGLRSQCWKSS